MSGIFFYAATSSHSINSVTVVFLKGCSRLWDMSTSTMFCITQITSLLSDSLSNIVSTVFIRRLHIPLTSKPRHGSIVPFDIGYTSKSRIILTLQISIFFFLSVTCFVFHTKLNRCCVTLNGDHYRIRPSQIDYLREHTLTSLLC